MNAVESPPVNLQQPGSAGPDGALDQDVLRHLLGVEANALALVDDAQAEADRRVAEAERLNRARYDERYGKEASALDLRYEGELAQVKGEYQEQLEAYRKTLDALPADAGAFGTLLDRLLIKKPQERGR
jgi:hypothetical protein